MPSAAICITFLSYICWSLSAALLLLDNPSNNSPVKYSRPSLAAFINALWFAVSHISSSFCERSIVFWNCCLWLVNPFNCFSSLIQSGFWIMGSPFPSDSYFFKSDTILGLSFSIFSVTNFFASLRSTIFGLFSGSNNVWRSSKGIASPKKGVAFPVTDEPGTGAVPVTSNCFRAPAAMVSASPPIVLKFRFILSKVLAFSSCEPSKSLYDCIILSYSDWAIASLILCCSAAFCAARSVALFWASISFWLFPELALDFDVRILWNIAPITILFMFIEDADDDVLIFWPVILSNCPLADWQWTGW